MAATLVLPLYPLEGQVLLPELEACVQNSPETDTSIASRADESGNALIASVADCMSGHEIAATRGRLLLLAVRELQRREASLRPWSHFRSAAAWN